MPNYVYSAKKERLKAVSVVVEATDDDDAESCLGDFVKALGLEGEWSDHFDLDEVIEDDDEDEPICKCGHPESTHYDAEDEECACGACGDDPLQKEPCQKFEAEDEEE